MSLQVARLKKELARQRSGTEEGQRSRYLYILIHIF